MEKKLTIIKPLIEDSLTENGHDESCNEQIKTLNNISWPSTSSWQDGSRRSAFQPYRPTTVLTNLQRGNIQTHTPQLDPAEVTWFEKAGRGDITPQDIKEGIDIDTTDDDGFSALMWSAAYGQTSTVQLLVRAGANIHKRGNNDETALHLAASGGHHDVIKFLLSHGADVNVIDSEGNTPLMYAVIGDHPHSVNELLLKGADMTKANIYDQKPFIIAVQNQNVQAQLVLEIYMASLFGSH